MDFDADDLKKKYGKYTKYIPGFGNAKSKPVWLGALVQKARKGMRFRLRHLVLLLGLAFMVGNIAMSLSHNQGGGVHETATEQKKKDSTKLGRQSGSLKARKRVGSGKLPQPGGFNDRVEDLVKSTKCPTNFFLAWTTKAEQFTLRYRRTVESTLRFHPDSCVVVISPTLPLDYFQTFWDLGYNIIVERPETEKLIQGTPAEHWWSNIDKWRKGPFFFSHHTEILRLATLWHYGGVYLDTDVIIMRPLKPDLHNCLGTELAGKYGEAKVLNGAILIFEKGSRFVWEAMHEFNSTYRIDSWGWNGPELVTRVARRFQHYEAEDKKARIEAADAHKHASSGGSKRMSRRKRKGAKSSANEDATERLTKGGKLYIEKMEQDEKGNDQMAVKDLTILPTDAFYPIHWAVVKKYFTLEDMQDQYNVWSRIEKNTYLFHYWNKITKDLVPEPGSLMYKVLNNYCLLCNESATDDGLPLLPERLPEKEEEEEAVEEAVEE